MSDSDIFLPRGVQRGSSPSKGKKKPSRSRDLSFLLEHGTSLYPYTGAWTDSRLEQVRHFKSWTFIAISSIAEQIAKHKPNISYVRSAAGKETNREKFFLKGIPRTRALTPLQSYEDLVPVENNHPLYRLLEDPNDPDSGYDLWYETVLFLLLTGSAYWWVPADRKWGVPEALWVVPSHWVWPVPGRSSMIESYEIRPTEGNYLRKVVPANEIIHFKRKSPVSRLDGYSPLTAVNSWIDTDEAIHKARLQGYKNGMFPTVSIQFDSDLEDPDEEMLRRIEAKFLARMVGVERSNKPMFLPPGWSVKPLTILPNQMVFGESAAETRDNILAAFKVPHIVAGISSRMTFGSVDAAQYGFFSFAVNPLCHFLASHVTEKLATPFYCHDEDTQLRVWWDDKSPNDPKTLDMRFKTGLLYGAYTPNEYRTTYGHEPFNTRDVPWADTPLIPVNMQPGSGPMGGDHQKPGPSADYEHPKISDEKDFEDFIRGKGRFSRNGQH